MEENLKRTSPIVQTCIKPYGFTFANVLLGKAGHLAQLSLDGVETHQGVTAGVVVHWNP